MELDTRTAEEGDLVDGVTVEENTEIPEIIIESERPPWEGIIEPTAETRMR